ncbi:MAG TPA: glycosyltransferase family 4 protein [Chthonomonadaceae bacterium]|nr:glycosyltransferase family 4 protein [Chthonomonadaceae bacterium]
MVTESDILYIGFVLGHGGDAVQMGELAAGMAARGRRVRIVVPEMETTQGFAEQYRARGVLVERDVRIRADPAGAKQDLQALISLYQTYHAPIRHFHTGDVCLPRDAVRALDHLDLPPAYATLHSPYDTVAPGSPRGEFWAAAVTRRFHAITCPSRHACRTQMQIGVEPERVHHIPNAVDTRRYACGDGSRPRRELKLASDTPLIVSTSRMDEQKRPMDTLAAFRAIAQEFPDAHLAFVGQGSLMEAVRSLAHEYSMGDRVHLMGHRNDIPDWLAAATVWALPTEAENFSLSVLEALAAGCAIVSTLCKGNDEVLVEGENALIHAIGGEGQAEAIRRLLSDARLRQRLRQTAQHTAQAYDLPLMVNAYARLYDRSLREGSGVEMSST